MTHHLVVVRLYLLSVDGVVVVEELRRTQVVGPGTYYVRPPGLQVRLWTQVKHWTKVCCGVCILILHIKVGVLLVHRSVIFAPNDAISVRRRRRLVVDSGVIVVGVCLVGVVVAVIRAWRNNLVVGHASDGWMHQRGWVLVPRVGGAKDGRR